MRQIGSNLMSVALAAVLALGCIPSAAFAEGAQAANEAAAQAPGLVAETVDSVKSSIAVEPTSAANEQTTATYTHSDTATQGNVTLKVEWNDPTLGQPTAFHVSATGGSGNYKFNMAAPSYTSPNEWSYESVADPSRGEFVHYTDACGSADFTFTMTATGTYFYKFYVMDMGSQPYTIINTRTFITVTDESHPSVAAIVNSAVEQAKAKTDGSEYEMALYLHDWLLDQLEYDNSLKWSSAEAALTRGLGTCQAYESAYAKLLTAAGIENEETRDTGDGHTWNAMKIDGTWCQVDCTWDDTSDNWYGDLDQRHLHFGLTDELMLIAHSKWKNGSDSTYGKHETSLANNYFIRNGKANEWAEAYAERIQQHLDARETEFSIDADNQSFPPSISGIQNGIVAYAMNQRGWRTANSFVALTATSNVTTTSSYQWTAKYDFKTEYLETPVAPNIPARTVEDGEYLLAPSLGPRMALSASGSGCTLSASGTALGFSYDQATGCYRLTSGGMALTASGSAAALAEPDGSASQLWRVDACGDGWSVTSLSTGLALDVYCRSAREGNLVWLYEPNGTDAQSWALAAA